MATSDSTKSAAFLEFRRLNKFDCPGLQEVSTFSRTRLELRCAEMGADWRLYALPDDAYALFWRLMPFAAWGIPTDFEQMARVARSSPRKVKRLWPQLEPFFERYEDDWRLRENEWITAYLLPHVESRIPLRHLFRRLAEYWGRQCAYCRDQVERLAIEHIIPKARGGSDDLTNLTLACHSCNSRKGTKTAAEFGFPHIHDRARRIQ